MLSPPADYARIRVVHSFAELVSTSFADGVNALCWPRALEGDFGEILAKLEFGEGITSLSDEQLLSLELTPAGARARDFLLQDQELLRAHGLEPVLEAIRNCERDDEDAVVPTDVYSYHADRAPIEADTWLCSYHSTCTEALRNEDAVRRIDIPETRAQLLALYQEEHGPEAQDDDQFHEYLAEHCYDLHYLPRPGAEPYSFGLGYLWRIAIEYPGCPVLPCIHRAPETLAGQPPRLLLLS